MKLGKSNLYELYLPIYFHLIYLFIFIVPCAVHWIALSFGDLESFFRVKSFKNMEDFFKFNQLTSEANISSTQTLFHFTAASRQSSLATDNTVSER